MNALPSLTIDDRLKGFLSALTLNQEQRSHLTFEQNRPYVALAAFSAITQKEFTPLTSINIHLGFQDSVGELLASLFTHWD